MMFKSVGNVFGYCVSFSRDLLGSMRVKRVSSQILVKTSPLSICLLGFDPSKNIAPKKFFERMKADLLRELLEVMVSFIHDEARSNLVAGIIAVVETSGPALETQLVETYGSEKAAQVMGSLLITEGTQARQKVLSPQDIRQRLEQLRGQES